MACLGDTAELSREEIRRFQNQSRSYPVPSFLSDFRASIPAAVTQQADLRWATFDEDSIALEALMRRCGC